MISSWLLSKHQRELRPNHSFIMKVLWLISIFSKNLFSVNFIIEVFDQASKLFCLINLNMYMKRNFYFTIMMVLCFSTFLHAQNTIDTIVDENNGFNGDYISTIGIPLSNFYAQSFIANVTKIMKFGVVIKEMTPEGELILSIAADNGSGVPDYNAPIYQGTLKNPSTTGDWFYEEGLNIPVNGGQKYWVLIDGYNNAGASGTSKIGYSNNLTDSKEYMIYSNNAGVGDWSSLSGYPLAIYVEGRVEFCKHTVIVSDTSGALLSGVTVKLENHKSIISDENGVARYDTAYYSNGNAINWSAWKYSYSHESGSIVIEKNDTLFVELTPLTPYPVTFAVTDTTGGNTMAVEGVNISLDLYGDKLTDKKGNALYDTVYGEAIEWTATMYGYYLQTGTVVISKKTTVPIILKPIPMYPEIFSVKDTSGVPISGVAVYLDMYGEMVTNANGEARFDSVYDSQGESIYWNAWKLGYSNSYGWTIIEKNDTVQIELTPLTGYPVTFAVIDTTGGDTIAVKDVNISLQYYDDMLTDETGIAIYDSVFYTQGNDIGWTATKLGYYTQTGYIYVYDTTDLSIILEPKPVYSVVFAVNDTNGNSINGASVTLDVYGEKITNASGIAIYDTAYETFDPGIPYQISFADYFPVNGNLNLTSDTLINIELIHYPYFEITFHVTDGTNDIEGATVSLAGYDNAITDADGKAILNNVMFTDGKSISFEVTGTKINRYDGIIEVDMSRTIDVIVGLKVGISEMSAENIKVYPNPGKDIVTVISSEEIRTMEIITIQGTVVKTVTNEGDAQINISGLSDGNYLLIIRTENNTYTERLTIIE